MKPEADRAQVNAAEPSSEAPPSSTEGKKLVAGGVRPFRSNTDLLETLKKRRQQVAEAKTRHSNSEPSAASEAAVESAKSNYNNKKRAGFTNAPPKEITNEEVPAPSKPSRGRFGRPATKSIQPEVGEEPAAAGNVPAARNGRTFARRGSN
ncbi:Uncharacterized protein OBRU01_09698 [Operophtera brumata]|uniref:Uncharacterized protein n=1 Tax=Operophtera brumata TaxID=104452 RepID=A0A0L7LDK6_OPEBR|nr:Uncharacterized protein OBRU01_09698 [Operophtera brumata]